MSITSPAILKPSIKLQASVLLGPPVPQGPLRSLHLSAQPQNETKADHSIFNPRSTLGRHVRDSLMHDAMLGRCQRYCTGTQFP